MEGTPRLYDTLVQILSQHQNWVDLRHLKTLAWMIVGLLQSGKIGLTAWAPYVHSRAVYAQSSVRRFARWLENERIAVHYGKSLNIPAAVWPTTCIKMCWIRWQTCFPFGVTSSLPRIVVSQTRISWTILRGWVGIGVFVSKGVFGFIVVGSAAAK